MFLFTDEPVVPSEHPLAGADQRSHKRPRRPALTVDTLVAEILRLPPGKQWELCDRLVGRLPGWTLRQQRLAPERFPIRNARIRAARQRGLSYGQIAKLEGMTRGAVRNVIRRGQRVSTTNGCTQAKAVTLSDG